MKKIMMLAALALMLITTAAFAAKGEWTGGGQGGVHVPSGKDYGDDFKIGFLGGVLLNYGINDMFTLGANLDLHQAKAKDSTLTRDNLNDLTVTIFNYGVNGAVSFMPEGPAHPYLKAGVGLYNAKLKAEASAISGEVDESKFGFSGGAGLMFQPVGNPIGFGVEGQFHSVPDVFTDVTTGEKLSLQFFTVTGRITFSFSGASQK